MNQDAKALEDLKKKALSLSPMNILRYEGYGIVTFKQNRIDECIDLLNIGTSAGLRHLYNRKVRLLLLSQKGLS